MDVVVEHLKGYAFLYVLAAIGLIPLFFVTRKWTVPFILYTIEVLIYLALMHLAVYVFVGVTRWFRESSSMKALRPEDGRPVDTPEWGTPLLQFWDKALYDPQWIIWVEVVFAFILVFLVLRYRPMKVQGKRKKRHFATEHSSKKYAAVGDSMIGKDRGKGRDRKRR